MMNEFQDFESILKTKNDEEIRKKVVIVQYVSIFFTIMCMVSTGYFAIEDYSMTALAIFSDNFLDILLNLLVLWRYFTPDKLNSKRLEFYSSLVISVLFFLSALVVEFESIRNLIYKTKPVKSVALIIVSIIQSVIFSLLSIYKFYLAHSFSHNGALISSAIDAFITGLGSFTMALGMFLFYIDERIWFLDSSFGIVIGFLIFVYGCHLFINSLLFKY